MATGVFGRDDESGEGGGIPNFVGPDEQKPKVASPSPPPVIDIASLAAAINAVQLFTRPQFFDPINFVDTKTTVSPTYIILVQWLPKAPGGVLKEISMTADPNAQYKLLIGGKEQFKDKPLSASLSIDYQRMRVPAGGIEKEITIYIRTPTAASITVSGLINGEQVLPPSA